MTFTPETSAPEAALPLAELVSVRPRFLRSVNLERDFRTPDALEGYVPTPSALSALERITAGVTEPAKRAWSVTGPYGTGKSALALRLTKTLMAEGFRPVLVTGGREPMAAALLRALRENGLRENDLAAPEADLSAREVAGAFEQAARAVRERDAQCRGLLLVIDELGKFLEYAALHPERGDVQVLQELAEAAVRSGDAPLLIVTILHQAFDEYAHRLPGAQQAEWRKVQGRFADIAFGDAAEDAARLVAGAVARAPHPQADAWLAETFARYGETSRALQLQPKTLSAGEWEDVCRRAWPLHPVTLLCLPHVFRRFGQNERSLFGFLASAGPHGFADFLGRHALTAQAAPPALRVCDLFDYVADALGAGLLSHAQAGRAWAQTQDALIRCESRPPAWTALVKTVGLLHALGDAARLGASREMLRFACDGFPIEDVDAALDGLQSSTLLTYRHYKKAYRPYEGSDIDVEARVRDARAVTEADPVRVASRLALSSLSIVARRHSYQTGTLRAFAVRACRAAELGDAGAWAVPDGADGLLALCLTRDGSLSPNAGPLRDVEAFSRPELLLRVARETDALRGAAADVEALQRVQEETPELAGDGVARREVEERLAEASAVFQSEWEGLLREDAGPEAFWLWQGERAEGMALQPLLSRACDAAYPFAPPLRNELINRRQLTSVAAAARRELITAMLTRAPDARLGIEGWPPEACKSVSVLGETGLHRVGGFFPARVS